MRTSPKKDPPAPDDRDTFIMICVAECRDCDEVVGPNNCDIVAEKMSEDHLGHDTHVISWEK